MTREEILSGMVGKIIRRYCGDRTTGFYKIVKSTRTSVYLQRLIDCSVNGKRVPCEDFDLSFKVFRKSPSTSLYDSSFIHIYFKDINEFGELYTGEVY